MIQSKYQMSIQPFLSYLSKLVGTSGNSTKGCNFPSLSYWKKSLDFCVWQVRVCSNNGVKGAWSGLGFYWSKPPKQMKALFIEGGSCGEPRQRGKASLHAPLLLLFFWPEGGCGDVGGARLPHTGGGLQQPQWPQSHLGNLPENMGYICTINSCDIVKFLSVFPVTLEV